MNDEQTEQTFNKQIKELNDDDFWAWVSLWKDRKEIEKELQEWSYQDMKEGIQDIEFIKKLKRHKYKRGR